MQFWVSYQMNYLMCIALYQASEKMSKKYILEDVRFQKCHRKFQKFLYV